MKIYLPKKKTDRLKSIKDNIRIEIALFKSMIARKLYKKNFLYLKKKCAELNIDQVNKVLNFFAINNSNHHKVETLNLTKHSIVISSKID